MTVKEKLHLLVEQLPEQEIEAARRFLEYLRDADDPLLRALRDAPEDDEPVGGEEQTKVEKAYQDLRAGKTTTHQELRREFE